MKKQYRSFAAFLFALICILSFAVPSIAANSACDVIVSLRIDDPIMEVNGAETEIDVGRDTKPIVINNRTLVPIRAIIEAFGGEVGWDGDTQTVSLTMEDDAITLVINDKTAYLNNVAHALDVAPAVINDRTMLPIRFIAEGFNIGVAWEGDTQTVTLVRNGLDDQEYSYLTTAIPAYSGTPYSQVNNGIPFFKDYEIIKGSFEYYSNLDALGRCDVCMASVGDDLLPTEDRESISSVTPSGWINAMYDGLSGKYLYNRCHLIAYQLTAENANERNLITGTRYLNTEGMLPFENKIATYVEETGNHVMYRVSPVFKENNLVANGVLLEAYSVEDNGQGISFCVYCYNVQPTILIDYATGASRLASEDTTPSRSDDTGHTTQATEVYRTPTGKKYHLDAECGGKNSVLTTLEEAIGAGLTPCAKCAK